MLTRRRLLLLAAATLALANLRPGALHAQDAASDFIQQNGQRILTLAPDAEGSAAVRGQLLSLVNQVLDVEGIARFALGPYARRASPQQMQRYLQVFHQVISTGVTARLAAYANARFTVGRSNPQGDGTLVHTVVARPGSPAANVDWLVGTVGGQTRILDVLAEGTSLRLTERSDYTSFLQSHGGDIDALLSALAAQVAR